MPPSPRTYTGRSSAEARYRRLRLLAFEAAQAELTKGGINVDLRLIDATALESFRTWGPRGVAWPWPAMAADWRKAHPERFELAVWSGDILCAHAIGRPSRSADHVSLHYLEANPDPGHPLRRKITAVAVTALEACATAVGKHELRLVDPLPALIPFYCSSGMGFERVRPRGEAPYCGRSIRR